MDIAIHFVARNCTISFINKCLDNVSGVFEFEGNQEQLGVLSIYINKHMNKLSEQTISIDSLFEENSDFSEYTTLIN
jgi:hypothetical protein